MVSEVIVWTLNYFRLMYLSGSIDKKSVFFNRISKIVSVIDTESTSPLKYTKKSYWNCDIHWMLNGKKKHIYKLHTKINNINVKLWILFVNNSQLQLVQRPSVVEPVHQANWPVHDPVPVAAI